MSMPIVIGQIWKEVDPRKERADFDETDKKAFVIMRVLCELASANFPSETEIKMSCKGKSMGSVTVKPWTLINLLDHANQ